MSGVMVSGSQRKMVSVEIPWIVREGHRSAQDGERLIRNVNALKEAQELRFADCACMSWDGDRDENQDYGFYPSPGSLVKLFCVLDGHGVGGKAAASYACHELVQRCLLHRLLCPDAMNESAVQESMKKAFQETQQLLLDLLQKKQQECGSTVILVQMVGKKTLVANVGDSRCVLVSNDGNGNDVWTAIPLSCDHSFTREDERQRIRETSQGEIVLGAGNMMRVMPGGGFPKEEIKRQALALAMTRALGHPVLSRYGVSTEPEFSSTEVRAGQRLVLASDGLWDVLENIQVAQLSGTRPSSLKCCQTLMKEAKDIYVKGRERGIKADNTTVVVVYIEDVDQDTATQTPPRVLSRPNSQSESTPPKK